MPVAVLGTADFHVTQIDPATVMLEGVAPLTWSVEDVGTPWEEFPAVPQSHDDCNDLESDGFLDLTVKYKTQEVVGALGCDTLNDGDVLTLFLQGALREEYGALLFDGFDVVVIRKKGLDC